MAFIVAQSFIEVKDWKSWKRKTYHFSKSIPAHNFQKLALLQDYISSNKVDILCLSETFLNSDISCEDNNLQVLAGIWLDKSRQPIPFNTKSSSWYTGDTTTSEGSKIDTITSQFGLQQIIHEPTHIQSVSCIDLIFSSQPNLVMSSGIHSSLHQNCHHQIIFAKFNLKVHYPPPYEREVWHFKKVNAVHIKRAINGFPWERSFANLDINDIYI